MSPSYPRRRGAGVARRFFRLPFAACLVCSALVAGLTARPAVGMTRTTLPDGFEAMVVDSAAGRVFVSSPESSTITVLDFAGRILKTISGEPGAAGMVLVGDTLYVALFDAGALDAIDTSTLQRRSRLADGGLIQPRTLAFAAGRLWTASGETGQKKLVSVDPETGATSQYETFVPTDTRLVSSPGDPNLLIGWDRVPRMATGFVRWDVSTDPPAVAARLRTDPITNTEDVAVTPDGKTFFPAAGRPTSVTEHQVEQMQPFGTTYPSETYPNSVALSQAGGGLVAIGSRSLYDPDIKVYPRGSATPLFTHDFNDEEQILFARGLAFNPNGLAIFAVTGKQPAYGDGPAYFNVVQIDRFSVSSHGWNGYGQMGTGSTVQPALPSTVKNLGKAANVAAGLLHSAAVRPDGTVWTWGWNGVGQLGNGTTQDRSSPVRAGSLTDAVAVSAGYAHTLALKRDGSVWSWGSNGFGQLGIGTRTNRLVPVPVPGMNDVVEVSAGAYHSLARKSDGTVWAWGWNALGQLGDGSVLDRDLPVRVAGLSGAAAVAAGTFHSLAADASGKAFGWGWNGYGQLGDGSFTDSRSPRQVPGVAAAARVAAGMGHSHMVDTTGKVWSWGWNVYGQLGNGSLTDSPVPVRTFLDQQVDEISAGLLHTVVISNHRAFAWGWNALDQVGRGNAVAVLHAMPVPGSIGAYAGAAGGYHSLVAHPDA